VVLLPVGVKVTALALDESQARTPDSGMNGQVPLKVDLLICSLWTNYVSVLAPHAAIENADATTNAAIPEFLMALT
jgi:hypothetical protein